MRPSLTDTLRAVINPRSVAVVGASNDEAKFGGRVMRFLVKHGYAGRIIPVNPKAGSVLGITAYRTLADADASADVALLAVPASNLPEALEQCGAAGVACCVVLSADFAELGDEGFAREAELVRIARRHDMRLIGPNCLGFINPHAKLALTSSVALAMEPMPIGAIGLVSQSGSMMASMISHAADAGIGFSACVTVGNQADLETCDFIEYFLTDETTRAICTYIEGLRDGTRFLTLARRCRAAGKPLLALKAGRSEAGSRIARSHTASLAGTHAIWEAACHDCGVIAVDDPESMIDCAQFLVTFEAPRCAGIAALSPSGGTIAVTADRIAAAGLTLAPLSAETREALARMVPPSRPFNPLDVGGLPREHGVSAANQAQALLAEDPTVGIVMIVVATTPQLNEKVSQWGSAALASGKPTAIVFTPGSLVDTARKALREIGCPYTNRIDDALRVMRAAVDYGHALKPPVEEPRAPDFAAPVRDWVARQAAGALSEPEAKGLLRIAAMPCIDDRLAESEEEAVETAERFSYPVVLKAVCAGLIHKSDIGAVKLNLSDAQSVRKAWREVRFSVASRLPEARFRGCLVQPMAASGVELILGAKWDPQFGAVVMAGAGGILVEMLDDVAFALAPLTRARAHALLERLQIWPLLDGARGRARGDVDAAADALVRLSWIASAAGPRLLDLEVNPLLVRPEGVLALDARATIA